MTTCLRIAVSGEIYKMELDGTVLGKFGKAGKQLKEFTTVHAIDCRNDNDLLTAEITGWRVQRLALHPQSGTTSGEPLMPGIPKAGRDFMKLFVYLFCVVSLCLAGSPLSAQSVPEISYDSTPNFLKLPNDTYLGEVLSSRRISRGTFLSTRAQVR